MLSQENRDKLIITGLYKCEPDRGIHSWYDDPYWCFNWTFKVKYYERSDEYYMIDTYFRDKSTKLTDDNIDKFTLIFDFNDVKPHSGTHIYEYDESDVYHVAIDSGGMYCGGKYFIKKDAVKIKQKILDRIQSEINSKKWELERLENDYQNVLNDIANLNYV